MIFAYCPLIIQFPLTGLEKLTVFALVVAVLIFFFDMLNKTKKKRRKSRMQKDLIYITEYKWNDLIRILTYKNNVNHLDVQNTLQMDFNKFDSKHKDILYHELFKIKNFHDVNPNNWNVLIGMIFNDGDKKSTQ